MWKTPTHLVLHLTLSLTLFVTLTTCQLSYSQNINPTSVLYPTQFKKNTYAFGTTVSMSGSWLAVSDPSSYYVSIYSCQNSMCTFSQNLTEKTSCYYGYSLSLKGDKLIVGCPTLAVGNGALFFYGLTGNTWSLTGNFSGYAFYSGLGVAVQGNTAAAFMGRMSAVGWVYFFDFSGGKWGLVQNITSSSFIPSAYTVSMAMSTNGMRVVFNNGGSVFSFDRINGNWNLTNTMTSHNGYTVDFLPNTANDILVGGGTNKPISWYTQNTTSTVAMWKLANTISGPTEMYYPFSVPPSTLAHYSTSTPNSFSSAIATTSDASGNIFAIVSDKTVIAPWQIPGQTLNPYTIGTVWVYQLNTTTYQSTLVSQLLMTQFPSNVVLPVNQTDPTSISYPYFGQSVTATSTSVVVGAPGKNFGVNFVYIWDTGCKPFTTPCYSPNDTSQLVPGCMKKGCCIESTYTFSPFDAVPCSGPDPSTIACEYTPGLTCDIPVAPVAPSLPPASTPSVSPSNPTAPVNDTTPTPSGIPTPSIPTSPTSSPPGGVPSGVPGSNTPISSPTSSNPTPTAPTAPTAPIAPSMASNVVVEWIMVGITILLLTHY